MIMIFTSLGNYSHLEKATICWRHCGKAFLKALTFKQFIWLGNWRVKSERKMEHWTTSTAVLCCFEPYYFVLWSTATLYIALYRIVLHSYTLHHVEKDCIALYRIALNDNTITMIHCNRCYCSAWDYITLQRIALY